MGFFPISSQGVRNFTSCRRRRRHRCRRRTASIITATGAPARRCCNHCRHLCRRCAAAIFTATTAPPLPPRSTASLPQLVESFCCLLQFKPTDTTRVYFAGAELNYSVSAQWVEYQKKISFRTQHRHWHRLWNICNVNKMNIFDRFRDYLFILLYRCLSLKNHVLFFVVIHESLK